MKKILIVLVIVIGLGSLVVKADEPLEKKSAKVEQRNSWEDFAPIGVNNLSEVVIDELSCERALIREAFIAYSRSGGKLYRVTILSSDFHGQAVFLSERGNILNRQFPNLWRKHTTELMLNLGPKELGLFFCSGKMILYLRGEQNGSEFITVSAFSLSHFYTVGLQETGDLQVDSEKPDRKSKSKKGIMTKINDKLVRNFLTEGMITALSDWFAVLGRCGSNGKSQRMVEALSIGDELNAYWG